ncbi:MAG: hypothetical protein Kow0065_06460 [Methylomicrobium sp.]
MNEKSLSNNESIPLYKPKQLSKKRKRTLKSLKARKLIGRYTLIAGGVGLIPSPLAGQFAVGGLLVKLMSELCDIYGIRFSDHQIKNTIMAILGGAHYDWISHYLIKYVRGYTPIPSSTASFVLRPAVSGLLVYYIGKLFLLHLESGAWIRSKETGFAKLNR